MPWYWTDDLTAKLIELGRLPESTPIDSMSPLGIRRTESSVEEAAKALQDDGEIPLAA